MTVTPARVHEEGRWKEQFVASGLVITTHRMEKAMMFSQDEFAYAVATEGPEAHEIEMTRIAHAAYRRGVPVAVVEAMVDRSLPEILRQRALGVAMRTMANMPRMTATDVPAVSPPAAA